MVGWEQVLESDSVAILAKTVRHYRTAREWSIDQLVLRSGVSKGAIVAVENGTTNPSLGTIARLADALGVSVTDLLHEERSGDVQVISPTDFRLLWRGPHGGEAHLIETVASPAPVELWRWFLPAGEAYDGAAHPDGFRESLIVESGSLELQVGTETRIIPAGSVAIFEPNLPHRYAAHQGDAEFIMLVHLLPSISLATPIT